MSKNIDLALLSIKKIIVHDIPKHKLKDLSIEPTYSDNESKLNDGLRMFFKTKIIQALSSDRSIKVVYNPESTSPVSLLVGKQLNIKDNEFIKFSKEITKHLFTIQGGHNSGGIMVIMQGEVSGTRYLIIMKLERDNGVQLSMDLKTNTIDIVEVQDLMLTNKTKVFKIALLFERIDKIDFDGQIMDFQVDLKQKEELSNFFMSAFLGCKPYKDPKITTQEFYRYTKSFIKTIDDEILKAKYLQDLNSYIQINTRSLSPRTFTDNYLADTAHKNKYKDYLKEKNFSFGSFIKDTALISSKIKKISIEFMNGITILGEKGTLENKVKLTDNGKGMHKAEIISKIKNIN